MLRSLWRALVRAVSHQCVWIPADHAPVADESGRRHLAVQYVCRDCGKPRVDTLKICPALGLLLIATTASAQPAAPFMRAPELRAALVAASASVAPVNGVSVLGFAGNSNMLDISTAFYGLLKNGSSDPAIDYKSLKRPELKVSLNAKGGLTINQWANPNESQWASFQTKAASNGYDICAVQWLVILLTKASPQTPTDYMTDAQLDAVVMNALSALPCLKGLTFVSLNWTNCTWNQSGCLVPTLNVHHEDAQLAAFAGVHNGIPVDYLPLYSDGGTPNPATVSPRFPQGIAWSDALLNATDHVHTNTAGTQQGAQSLGDRMLHDPDGIFWWMWAGQDPPTVEDPPPPDPPVSVPLSGTLTLDGFSCTFTAEQGTVSLPVSWCGDL
jgi:hypothetical protein